LFQIQNPVRDLLYSEIDHSQNILGNFFLERERYTVIVGPSGIGKSVVAIQIAIEAAAGDNVFGMVTPGPLRVLVVQAEDSRNDLIAQVQIIKQMKHSEELLKRYNLTPEEIERRIETNFTIVTTSIRGAALFEKLTKEFTDLDTGNSQLDLVIFNPAFAFLEGSASSDEAVKTFLRKQLQPFLRKMRAAAIIVHHVPKPPRRGTAKRSAETLGHAVWAGLSLTRPSFY
jgi:RecA-family ATPase